MNYRPRPRKKHQVWLPIACGLLLAIGSGFLYYTDFNNFFTKDAAAPKSVAPEPTPAAPHPAPVSVTEGAQPRKTRQPIFDRNMVTMAVSFTQSSVYLKPIELQEGQNTIEQLAEILDLSAKQIQTDLRTKRTFVWLKRNLNADTAQKIAKSNFSGVYLVDELQRYYPLHDHAAHIVGFVKDELGLAGAEFIYDPILRGNRDLVFQYLNLPGLEATDIPPEGAAIVLSVDIDLQVLLEKKLQLLLPQTTAKSASAVLVETGSGEILAMAETPEYDPNVYWKANNSVHQNKLLGEPLPMVGFNAFFKAAAELSAGNLPPEMVSREEDADRILLPRVMKIAKGDIPIPKTKDSQVWQPGIHLSPPFQWPLNFKQQDEDLTSFCKKLGLSALGTGLTESQLEATSKLPDKESTCDLNDDSWRVAPLTMLAAFSQLTNGGKAISPHLLQGLWQMDNNTFHPASFTATESIGSEASSHFISFVKTLLPPGPSDDLIIESIRSAAKEAAQNQDRVLGDESTSIPGDTFRYSSTTLASGSQQNEHQLTLLMMVDGAKISLTLPSPFRKAAAEIISQADSLMAKRWANETKAPKLDSDALLYQKWSLSQTLDTPRPVLETLVEQEMPELIGLSLRKAMQALQSYNVKVNVQGTGRVTRQSPAAGSRLKGVSETTLELQMDN